MNKLVIIEIAISITLVYFVLSTFVSSILEIFNQWFKSRGKYLQKQIYKRLNDSLNKNWGDLLYAHPLVDGLKKNYKTLPSYISGETFGSGMIDVISREGYGVKVNIEEDGSLDTSNKPKKDAAFENFKEGLKTLNPSDFTTILYTLLNESANIKELKSSFANWYDDYTERTSGWFVKRMKKWTLMLSVLVTLVFNIDSIEIIKTIWNNDDVRTQLVYEAAVQKWIESDTTNAELSGAELSDLKQSLDTIPQFLGYYGLPFGWKTKGQFIEESKDNEGKCYAGLLLGTIRWLTILGWIITIFALTMGAPFWFNLMNKFINMRSEDKKPEASKS